MSIPAALPGLAHQREFWLRFFWSREGDGHRYDALTTFHIPVPRRHRALLGERFPMCRLDYVVGGASGLRLEFPTDLSNFELYLLRPGGQPANLATDNLAHWVNHALRWEEADWVCRAASLLHPDWGPHPGLALLALFRFAPITEADAPPALALLRAARRWAGMRGETASDRFVRRVDGRRRGFVWSQRPDGRWLLGQQPGSRGTGPYTTRHARNSRFPHEGLAECLAEARRACAEALGPGWSSPVVLSLAEGIATGAGLDGMAALADALEEAGCVNGCLLSHLRDAEEPARGAWVVEALLGRPWGEVLRLCPGDG